MRLKLTDKRFTLYIFGVTEVCRVWITWIVIFLLFTFFSKCVLLLTVGMIVPV